MATFEATLMKWSGKGAWTFAPVPVQHAPDIVGSWGRTPVIATVDGMSWATSVWRDKTHGTLLPVPARIRRGKGHGDLVVVEIEMDLGR